MGKQPIVIERSMQNHSMAAIRKQDMMRGMQVIRRLVHGGARQQPRPRRPSTSHPGSTAPPWPWPCATHFTSWKSRHPARAWRCASRRTRWSRSWKAPLGSA